MLSAINCRMRPDEAGMYMISHVLVQNLDIVFPDSYVICTNHSVHRIFRDAVDHMLYHASIEHARKARPPSPMWVDEHDLKAYKLRIREEDYARRNLYSETPQPRRPRSTRY